MPALRSGARRWIAAGILLLGAGLGWPPAAGAATTSFDVADGAVVQVIARSAAVTIRTWNRNIVQIDESDPDAFAPWRGTQATPTRLLVPPVSVEETRSPGENVIATLLPEDFPLPKLVPGFHDVVRVAEVVTPAAVGRAVPPAQLTVTIPDSTSLVNVRSGKGSVTLSDYRGTAIVIAVRGRVVFNDVGGDAFVQPLNGHFYAVDSTFDRLRIRSNRADEIFDACRAKQIEATTLTGNIMFDNGIFDPGLARFESDRGSIALGVNGGAQLGAHTQDGHVLTVLPVVPAPPFIGRDGGDDDGTNNVLSGGGGPLVNATSVHGDVFLYDGSLTDRRQSTLAPAWTPMYRLLVTNRNRERHDDRQFVQAHRPSASHQR